MGVKKRRYFRVPSTPIKVQLRFAFELKISDVSSVIQHKQRTKYTLFLDYGRLLPFPPPHMPAITINIESRAEWTGCFGWNNHDRETSSGKSAEQGRWRVFRLFRLFARSRRPAALICFKLWGLPKAMKQEYMKMRCACASIDQPHVM